jgi:3-oxoacyl-[acyl-carrier protein] reductase
MFFIKILRIPCIFTTPSVVACGFIHRLPENGEKNMQSVAIVTGAGKGIGFEICRELSRNGIAIVLNDMDSEATQKAVVHIQEKGGKCCGVSGDASDVSVIQKMVDTAVEAFGQVNIVIANAGITVFADFLDVKPEDFNKMLRVNLNGSFFLAQAAARQMIQQGRGGSILFMSSVTGHQAHQKLEAYGMTKAGLEMLAKGLVIELAPHKININAIAPGATLTERTLEDPDYTVVWSKITPMGKPALTSEIAHAAVFLTSEKARHITGQTLVIDGGWTSTSPSPYF